MSQNHVFSEKEARWLFSEDVTSLQELAAFQYTWKLWSNMMLSGKYHNYRSELKTAIDDTLPMVLKFIKCLKLGSILESKLIDGIYDIQSELLLWMIYNQEQMLAGRKMTLFTCHLKYIVFKPNTRLDYEGCARKLISSNLLDDRTAFEIMCRFCMEDELHSLPKDKVEGFLKKITFDKRPLAWYWICYLTDKEALKNKGEFVCFIKRRCCLESAMLTFLDVENWQNVRWFWRRLCDETDQMKRAVEVLKDINRTWFLRDFYYELNEHQWQYVFNTAAVDVLFAFFRHYQKFEQGWFLWERLRDSMTIEQFVDLMQRLMKPKEKALNLCFPTTTKLWNTAPDRFKNHILEHENCIIEDNFFEPSFVRQFDKNLQFLFELLNFASIEYRENIILTHGDVLFEVDDFSKIDKIIELCLPNAKLLDKFKFVLTGSKIIKKRCKKLFVDGNFALLNKFFESFCVDESAVNNFREHLLSSEKTCDAFIFEPNKWRDFEKFVGSIDSTSPLYPAIRDQVLRSCKLARFNDWSNVGQLDDLEKVLVQFFTHEELALVKTKFLDESRDMLNSFFTTFVSAKKKIFTAKFLEKLVSWLNVDGEGFKSKLKSIDSIFASTITSLLSVIRFENLDINVHPVVLISYDRVDTKILVGLDEFLKWYFGGTEQAKNYKLTKVFAFDDAEFYQEFNKTAEVDDGNVDAVLAWMLENDEEEIRKFKAKCELEDVSKKSSTLSL